MEKKYYSYMDEGTFYYKDTENYPKVPTEEKNIPTWMKERFIIRTLEMIPKFPQNTLEVLFILA